MSPAPSHRAEALTARLADLDLDAVIVGDLVRPGDSGREAMADLTWLTGFRGSSGIALLTPERRLFLTDSRYLEQAARQLPGEFEVVDVAAKMLDGLAGSVAELDPGRVGIDAAATAVESLRKLEERLEEVELVAGPSAVADLRRVKDGEEIATIAEAARLTDEVYEWLQEHGLAGRTERALAVAAEARMRELGAEDPSFHSIVAAGPNGALPHATPGERPVEQGEPVVVDMGAIVDGYCSDCTRTMVDGELVGEAREVYEIVLAGQLAGLEAVRAGIAGRDVDEAARAPIAEAGYEFGHGVGHGVGIEVHESPRLSKSSEDDLLAGDVVTVEPGVYLAGRFGVRIEDLVVVTEDGHRNLSGRPK